MLFLFSSLPPKPRACVSCGNQTAVYLTIRGTRFHQNLVLNLVAAARFEKMHDACVWSVTAYLDDAGKSCRRQILDWGRVTVAIWGRVGLYLVPNRSGSAEESGEEGWGSPPSCVSVLYR